MNSQSGGQSSHSAGEDRYPRLARAWYEVRPDVLWKFVVELSAEHSLRGVQEMTGLAKETIRKFVERIGTPTLATRKALGELFLKHQPRGAMPEPSGEIGPDEVKLRTQLIELLPPGEENALAAISLIFEIARRFPQYVPNTIDAIQRWMELQVQGEYDAERFYAQFAKRERKPKTKTKDGSRKHKRSAKPKRGTDEGSG